MVKHKRIPYDPPGKRKRKKQPDRRLRADQKYLTRRAVVMKGGIIGAFGVMAAKLGYMQLQEVDSYKKQAEENVIKTQLLPAPRGLILDRKGRPLATNRRAWELRVIPNDLPDRKTRPAERQHVLDTLVSALQIEDTLVVDEAALVKGNENTVFTRVAKLLGVSQADIPKQVDIWKRRVDAEDVLDLTPDGGLTPDKAAEIRAVYAEIPGVTVMNRLDYLIDYSWNPSMPVSVAKDVPREVALKLEANRMYLPGVELDDTVLIRDYVGGEVMSHVIGYVNTIAPGEIDDPAWRGKNGERLYEQNDVIGKMGIELGMEDVLRGRRGSQSVEQDASGLQMRIVPDSIKDPVPGKNVYLTIDLEYQNAVSEALQAQIKRAADAKKKVNADREKEGRPAWPIPRSGAAVAFDPRNGEVHAMVSYPFFDNRLFATGISPIKWDEYTKEGGPKAFLNRVTSEQYPPGSTFKIFLATSALGHGSLKTDTTYSCQGGIAIPSGNSVNLSDALKMACWTSWHEGMPGHQELDVYGAIEQSCDVFFYNVAQERYQPAGAFEPLYYYDYNLNTSTASGTHAFSGLGIDPFVDDLANKFRFGVPTGIEIGESPGYLDTPTKFQEATGESWTVGRTLNMSIGQGDFRATPLQMVYNAGMIAMNGKGYTPRLVHDTRTSEVQYGSAATATVPATATQDAPQDVKPATAFTLDQAVFDIVHEGMRRCTEGELGTARANGDGSSKWALTNPEGEDKITVAGKTGTSEYGPTDEVDGSTDTHAWFLCYAPLEKPEIAVAVVIEGGGEGSTFAVPVADAMLRGYFELTGKRPRGKVLDKKPMPV